MQLVSKIVWLLWVLVWVPTSGNAETYRFAFTDVPPYVSGTLKGNGLAPQVIEAALKSQGHETRVHLFFSLPSTLQSVRAGEVHGTVAWNKTPQREERFYHSIPIWESKLVFFFAKDQYRNWTAIDQLSELKMGFVKSSTTEALFKSRFADKNLQMVSVPENRLLFHLLTLGKLDTVPFELETGKWILEESKQYGFSSDNVKYNERPIQSLKAYVIVPKSLPDAEQLIKIIDTGIRQIYIDGTIDRLVEQYLPN